MSNKYIPFALVRITEPDMEVLGYDFKKLSNLVDHRLSQAREQLLKDVQEYCEAYIHND